MKSSVSVSGVSYAAVGRRGLSLIELLAVVMVLLLLGAMLLPGLNAARGKASRTVCLNNLRQLGISLRLYTADNADWLPAPTMDFGQKSCWFYAVDKYLGGTVSAHEVPPTQLSAAKQDPTWGCFPTDSRENMRSLKMNRKLLGNRREGTSVALHSANPGWRRLSSVASPVSTPLVFDGRCADDASNPKDPAIQRYDGWEVWASRRHDNGANIMFVDGHVERWTTGKARPQGGWEDGSTGLTWWVD